MENSRLLKVTPKVNFMGGNYIARSFSDFGLRSLRGDLCSLAAMLGGDRFTEVYFRTRSGNIYKLFRTTNEFGQRDKWVLVNKASRAEYYPTDAEMYYSHLKVGEIFHYGNGSHTTEVSEIVCVNTSRHQFNLDKEPEAVLVQQFNTILKGTLAPKVK